MLRHMSQTDRWDRVAEEVKARMGRVGYYTQQDLIEASRRVDRSGRGVSDATWRKLLKGEPVKRADRLQLASLALRWTYDSIDLILAGHEPIPTDDQVEGLDEMVAQLADHESRLTRITVQLQTMARQVEEIGERVRRAERTLSGLQQGPQPSRPGR